MGIKSRASGVLASDQPGSIKVIPIPANVALGDYVIIHAHYKAGTPSFPLGWTDFSPLGQQGPYVKVVGKNMDSADNLASVDLQGVGDTPVAYVVWVMDEVVSQSIFDGGARVYVDTDVIQTTATLDARDIPGGFDDQLSSVSWFSPVDSDITVTSYPVGSSAQVSIEKLGMAFSNRTLEAVSLTAATYMFSAGVLRYVVARLAIRYRLPAALPPVSNFWMRGRLQNVKPKKVFVKRSGAWAQVKKAYVKSAGVWKLFHDSSMAPTVKVTAIGKYTANGSSIGPSLTASITTLPAVSKAGNRRFVVAACSMMFTGTPAATPFLFTMPATSGAATAPDGSVQSVGAAGHNSQVLIMWKEIPSTQNAIYPRFEDNGSLAAYNLLMGVFLFETGPAGIGPVKTGTGKFLASNQFLALDMGAKNLGPGITIGCARDAHLSSMVPGRILYQNVGSNGSIPTYQTILATQDTERNEARWSTGRSNSANGAMASVVFPLL